MKQPAAERASERAHRVRARVSGGIRTYRHAELSEQSEQLGCQAQRRRRAGSRRQSAAVGGSGRPILRDSPLRSASLHSTRATRSLPRPPARGRSRIVPLTTAREGAAFCHPSHGGAAAAAMAAAMAAAIAPYR